MLPSSKDHLEKQHPPRGASTHRRMAFLLQSFLLRYNSYLCQYSYQAGRSLKTPPPNSLSHCWLQTHSIKLISMKICSRESLKQRKESHNLKSPVHSTIPGKSSGTFCSCSYDPHGWRGYGSTSCTELSLTSRCPQCWSLLPLGLLLPRSVHRGILASEIHNLFLGFHGNQSKPS